MCTGGLIFGSHPHPDLSMCDKAFPRSLCMKEQVPTMFFFLLHSLISEHTNHTAYTYHLWCSLFRTNTLESRSPASKTLTESKNFSDLPEPPLSSHDQGLQEALRAFHISTPFSWETSSRSHRLLLNSNSICDKVPRWLNLQ